MSLEEQAKQMVEKETQEAAAKFAILAVLERDEGIRKWTPSDLIDYVSRLTRAELQALLHDYCEKHNWFGVKAANTGG